MADMDNETPNQDMGATTSIDDGLLPADEGMAQPELSFETDVMPNLDVDAAAVDDEMGEQPEPEDYPPADDALLDDASEYDESADEGMDPADWYVSVPGCAVFGIVFLLWAVALVQMIAGQATTSLVVFLISNVVLLADLIFVGWRPFGDNPAVAAEGWNLSGVFGLLLAVIGWIGAIVAAATGDGSRAIACLLVGIVFVVLYVVGHFIAGYLADRAYGAAGVDEDSAADADAIDGVDTFETPDADDDGLAPLDDEAPADAFAEVPAEEPAVDAPVDDAPADDVDEQPTDVEGTQDIPLT